MKDVVIAREHEALNEVMHRSSSAQARIMVLDDTGRVIGLITPTDIIRTVQRELLRHRTGHPVGI